MSTTIHKVILIMSKILHLFLPFTEEAVVLGLTGLAVAGGALGFRKDDLSGFGSINLSDEKKI